MIAVIKSCIGAVDLVELVANPDPQLKRLLAQLKSAGVPSGEVSLVNPLPGQRQHRLTSEDATALAADYTAGS